MRAALVFVLVFVLAAGASAQPRGEALVRSHFEAEGTTIVDVRVRPDLRVGPAWWVRTRDADGTIRGHLVFVRAPEVIVGPGEDALREVLRADQGIRATPPHTPTRWTATALLTVMRELQVTIPLASSPITTHRVTELRPHVVREGGVLRLTLYAFRGGPPEAPATEQFWVTRAVLTIDAEYALRWTTADVVLDAHGRER